MDRTNSPLDLTAPGWTVGRSMTTEMDVALSIVGGYFPLAGLPGDLAELAQSAPTDWLAEWPALLGEEQHLVSLLNDAALLAGTMLEGDYAAATLPIRELTVDGAAANLRALAGRAGVTLPAGAAGVETLLDLAVGIVAASFAELGIAPEAVETQRPRLRESFARAARCMRGGDLHARFWHWLDRFYYEIYNPWRSRRLELMERRERQAALSLGGQHKVGAPPPTDWLPHQNPLRVNSQMRTALLAGKLHVFFWVEPFGMTDLWVSQPGLVLTAFSEAGEMFQNFLAFADDVAGRTRALADPTRLTILRIIRHFGAMNTEIADFLQLSRPTVSVHAKILREAGLIVSRQEGREVRHEIVPAAVRGLFQDLERFLDLPDD